MDEAPAPRAADLPDALERLAVINALKLRAVDWNVDIQALTELLAARDDFQLKSTAYKLPRPDPLKERTNPIEWGVLQDYLRQSLTQWNVEFSDDPVKLHHKRIELTRDFSVGSFEEVIEFMLQVGKQARVFDHHPRWLHVWTTMTVWLSTWDAGHNITMFDVQFAKYMDQAYKDFRKKRKAGDS